MNLTQSLIGKPFPVKDETGAIVATKPITNAVMMENVSGISISLSDELPSILINFSEAAKLAQE